MSGSEANLNYSDGSPFRFPRGRVQNLNALDARATGATPLPGFPHHGGHATAIDHASANGLISLHHQNIQMQRCVNLDVKHFENHSLAHVLQMIVGSVLTKPDFIYEQRQKDSNDRSGRH